MAEVRCTGKRPDGRACNYVGRVGLNQCPYCKSWGTFPEAAAVRMASSAAAGPKTLGEIRRERVARVSTRDAAVDKLFGGGIAKTSVILLSGEPGFGKSTFLVWLAQVFERPFYGVAEESDAQVAERIDRLALTEALDPKLRIWATRDAQALLEEESDADFRVCDSVHAYDMPAGELVPRLVWRAKERGEILVLVGHVNKEGDVSGVRALEHWVDTTISGSVDEASGWRTFRVQKNRFGEAPLVMRARMTARGLGGFEIGGLS